MGVVVLNDTQNIYTIYSTSQSILVQKTTESGSSVLWSYTQTNADTKQNLSAALDVSSNVLITYTKVTGSATQIVVMKVSNTDTPVLLWSVSGYTASNTDSNSRVAADLSGNVLLAFQTNGVVAGGTKTGSTDVAVVKLDGTTGSTLWSVQNGDLNVSTQSNQTPGISVSPSGVSYVCYVTSAGVQVVEEISASGTVLNKTNTYPCFLAKTPVLTRYGYRPIETLKEGDELVSSGGQIFTVTRLLKKRVIPSTASNPYVIPEGMFGAKQRIYVSPNHKIHVPERGMVCAKDLGLRQWIMRSPFIYYNVELEQWRPMIVAGVTVESMAAYKQVRVTLAQYQQLIAAASTEKREFIHQSSRVEGDTIRMSILKSKWTKN